MLYPGYMPYSTAGIPIASDVFMHALLFKLQLPQQAVFYQAVFTDAHALGTGTTWAAQPWE